MKLIQLYNYSTKCQDGEDVKQTFLACNILQTDDGDNTIAPYISEQFESPKNKVSFGFGGGIYITSKGWWNQKKIDKAISKAQNFEQLKEYSGCHINYLFDQEPNQEYPIIKQLAEVEVAQSLLEKIVLAIQGNLQIDFLQEGKSWMEGDNYSSTVFAISPISHDYQKVITDMYKTMKK